MDNKKTIAIIPARGGSKGIPNKNLYPLLGKPLISWTIDAALASQYVDKIYVSTDSEEIAKVVQDYGATVIVFDLNGEYANLGFSSNGEKNDYYDRVHLLTPGANFKVSLRQTNLKVMLNILVHALNLPGTSTQEFRRIWRYLKREHAFSLQELGKIISSFRVVVTFSYQLYLPFCSLSKLFFGIP